MMENKAAIKPKPTHSNHHPRTSFIVTKLPKYEILILDDLISNIFFDCPNIVTGLLHDQMNEPHFNELLHKDIASNLIWKYFFQILSEWLGGGKFLKLKVYVRDVTVSTMNALTHKVECIHTWFIKSCTCSHKSNSQLHDFTSRLHKIFPREILF